MAFSSLKIESYRRGVLYSSSFNLFARGLSFLSNIVIAYFFGTQSSIDVYFYCLVTVTTVVTFLTSLDAGVIIPESMRLVEQKGKDKAMEFLNFFLYGYAILGVAAGVLLGIDPIAIYKAISQFDMTTLVANSHVLWMSVPLFPLMLISIYLVDVLTSFKYFTIPMISSMLNSIIVIGAILVLQGRIAADSIILGLDSAYVVQIAVLVGVMKKALKWDFAAKFVKLDSVVKRNIVIAELGNFATALSTYAPIFLLSGFSAGIVAALNFGQRIANLPAVLLANQVSAVFAIKANELYAKRKYLEFGDSFLYVSKSLLFVTVPIATIGFIYAPQIVSVFFNHGAFGTTSVSEAASFFRYLVLLLPFLAVDTLVARLLMAAQKVKAGAWFQTISNAVMVALTVTFVRIWGPFLYPVAILAVYVVYTVALGVYVRATFPYVQYGRVLINLLQLVCINGVLAVGLSFLNSLLGGVNDLVLLMSGSTVFAMAIGIVSGRLHTNDEFRHAIHSFLASRRRDEFSC